MAMQMRKWLAFLMMSLLLLAMAGCGNKKVEAEPEPKEQQEKAVAESAWPRTIKNDDGTEAVIEKKPEKIAVLHFGYAEYLLALNEAPIATTNKDIALSFETLKPYHTEINAMVDLGETMSPNLEELVNLKPDLIIAGNFQDEILENLRKIAPVVVDKRNKTVNMNWQDTITYYGEIVGAEDKAQQYIKETEKTIADTKQALAQYEDKTFVFLRPGAKGKFSVLGRESFTYYHDEGFGLKVPEGYPEKVEEMSLEGLMDLKPDYIFFQDKKELIDESIKQVENDNVWQNITAVKDGHVYALDISLNTGSPLAIELAAKDIIKDITE